MDSPKNIAWAAGLFEGEGSIGSYHQKPTYKYPTIRACMDMTDQDVVEHFGAVIGFGNVLPRPRRKSLYKTAWRWQTSKFETVQAMVAMFWPWLGERRKQQAKKALLEYRAKSGEANAI